MQVLSFQIGTIKKESIMIKNYIEQANFEDTGFSYTPVSYTHLTDGSTASSEAHAAA